MTSQILVQYQEEYMSLMPAIQLGNGNILDEEACPDGSVLLSELPLGNRRVCCEYSLTLNQSLYNSVVINIINVLNK